MDDARFIREREFYTSPRPPPEASPLQRAAATRLRFALTLAALGATGIAVQRGFLSQLVVGAPIFEEMAKLGIALLVIAFLRARSAWLMLPAGWLVGALFGLFEHATTYAHESTVSTVMRISFHAATTGASVAAFALLRPLSDVRARWMSILPAALIHWANNYGVLIASLSAALLAPTAPELIVTWSLLMTSAAFGVTALMLARPDVLRQRLGNAARHGLSGL